MTVSYATTAEVIAWLPADQTPDGDLARLIKRASELVDSYVRAEYPVDTTGAPTGDDVTEALRDAVCAQIEQWCEVSEANSIDGLAGTQISVDGYSGPRAPDLAPRAHGILKNAGLLSPVSLARGPLPFDGVWW